MIRLRLEEVIDGIYRVKVGMSYCFILDKPDGLYLLDGGFERSGKTVIRAVKEIRRDVDKELKAVVVSHHHVDHTAGLWKIEQQFNVPIYAHSRDVPVILRETNPPPGEGFLGRLFVWFLKLSRYHPPRTVLIADSQSFPFSVIHLPGHTDGHVALYDLDTKTLLCADLLTIGKNVLKLPPRFFNQSISIHLRSLRQLKVMIETGKLVIQNVIPSHGKGLLRDADRYFLEKIEELLERQGR